MNLKAKDLAKSYTDRTLFANLDFEIKAGQSIAIMGPSGVGKSTLLNILGLLDHADSGTIEIMGKSVKSNQRAALRSEHIGFVFQSYHLLDELTALENVSMPAQIRRVPCPHGYELLEEVGLLSHANSPAKLLSGGEKQRVAIARALCNNPSLILADEPTGNLDEENSKKIKDLLIQCCKEKGKSLIVVTHDQKLASRCDLTYQLKEGALWKSASLEPAT